MRLLVIAAAFTFSTVAFANDCKLVSDGNGTRFALQPPRRKPNARAWFFNRVRGRQTHQTSVMRDRERS